MRGLIPWRFCSSRRPNRFGAVALSFSRSRPVFPFPSNQIKGQSMKKRVKIQVSIAGSGDPSQTELERKYASLRRTLEEHSRAARLMNKTGRTAEEIESTVAAERRKDAAIPRVSGFTAPFS